MNMDEAGKPVNPSAFIYDWMWEFLKVSVISICFKFLLQFMNPLQPSEGSGTDMLIHLQFMIRAQQHQSAELLCTLVHSYMQMTLGCYKVTTHPHKSLV